MTASASPNALPADRLAAGLDTIVREAGALARGFADDGARQWRKADRSIVTEADLAVDRLLRERLSALEPAAGWLSEETADTPARLEHRRVWIVDPIDGTRSFVEGIPDWVVSVALVEDGRTILGAVFNPTRGEMFAARRGGGATLNGAPLRVPAAASLEDARISGPRGIMDRLYRIGIDRGEWIYALAYRLVSVAAGRIDAAIASANASDWDVAAADLVLHEAGAALSTLAGEPPRYNLPAPVHGPLVAAAAPLDEALRAAVRRVTDAADPSHRPPA